MSPSVVEVSFLEEKKIPLDTERRRTISKILPAEGELSGPPHHWTKIACLIGSAAFIGTERFCETRASIEHKATPSMAIEAMSLYRWMGFHRVAP